MPSSYTDAMFKYDLYIFHPNQLILMHMIDDKIVFNPEYSIHIIYNVIG